MNIEEITQDQHLAQVQHRLDQWKTIYWWALVISGGLSAISTVCLILLVG